MMTLARGIRPTMAGLLAERLVAATLARRRVQSTTAARVGGRAARRYGRGLNFAEVRPYQAGDDVRYLDWRIMARTGKPYTRLYHEDREQPLVLAVDLTANMFFGSKITYKSVYAAHTAALLAWLALQQSDPIAAVLATDAGTHICPFGQGRAAVLACLRALVKHSEPHTQPLAWSTWFAALQRATPAGSRVVMMSDFSTLQPSILSTWAPWLRQVQVEAIQVRDPLEIAPPPAGCYGISDGTRHHNLHLTTPRARQRYRDACDQHHAAIAAAWQRWGVTLLPLTIGESWSERLATGILRG